MFLKTSDSVSITSLSSLAYGGEDDHTNPCVHSLTVCQTTSHEPCLKGKQSRLKRMYCRISTFFGLKPGITRKHVFIYFVAVLFTICSFVYINTSQAFLLTDVFHIPLEEEGDYSGWLIFADELLAVCFIGVWGFLSDYFIQRKYIYGMGFIFMALGLGLYPNASVVFPSRSIGEFFSSLLFFRLIFSLGCSITGSLMAAFLSDSVSDDCYGKFAGVVGFCSGTGAVIGALVFPLMPLWFHADIFFGLPNFHLPYYLLALILVVIALVVMCGMCSHPMSTNPSNLPGSSQSSNIVTSRCTFLLKIKESILAASDSMICLAYVSGFLSRTITMVNTTFIPLWIIFEVRDLQKMNQVSLSAVRLTGKITGTLQLSSLLMAPFYGVLANRVSSRCSTALALSCCAISYGAVALLKDPTSHWMYLLMTVAGAGQIGMIVSGLALVSTHSPKHLRGSISGGYAFFGVLGILINSKLIGFLFHAWSIMAPFYVLVIWSLCALVFTFALSWVFARQKKKSSLITYPALY